MNLLELIDFAMSHDNRVVIEATLKDKDFNKLEIKRIGDQEVKEA